MSADKKTEGGLSSPPNQHDGGPASRRVGLNTKDTESTGGELRIGGEKPPISQMNADLKRDPDTNDIVGTVMEVHTVLGHDFLALMPVLRQI